MTFEDGDAAAASRGAEPEESVARLMDRLANAEAALAMVAAGQVDSIVQPQGYVYLLHEAQQALVANVEKLHASEAAALRQSALLTAVLESAPDIIFRVDAAGTISFVNRAPPPLTLEQVLHTSWFTHAPPEDRPAMRAALETVLATGATTDLERRGFGANRSIVWYASRLSPIWEEGRAVGAVIISRDITDRKESEAQLLMSDRMATVGTMAAGVAHEINNPLAALLANLDVIREDTHALSQQVPLPPDLLAAIGESHAAAERVKIIVRDLKLFSRVEADKSGPVDVEKVLDATLRMAKNEIRHRASLLREYAGVPLILANEARLGQVFLNLIVNAAQAIPEGKYDANQIRVSTSVDANGDVQVTIADTGAGIPSEVQKQLFTPFFTTKPVGVGTGLGLSICQRLVTGMGGRLSFTSVLGQGTEFRISLPRGRTPALIDAPPNPKPPSNDRRRVLVIDDDAMVLTAARRLLAPEHDVTVASSVMEARESFARGERFDLILCDLMMPQETGMDLYAELAANSPAQADRLVFMTGGAFTPSAQAFLESVDNQHIEKPFTLTQLRELISAWDGAK